jgi:hypothetical protein
LSPSLSSIASCAPVEAPDGTEDDETVPSSNVNSTLTVGLPRESRISIARTDAIFAIVLSQEYVLVRDFQYCLHVGI